MVFRIKVHFGPVFTNYSDQIHLPCLLSNIYFYNKIKYIKCHLNDLNMLSYKILHGDRLYTSESDVFIHQNLTYKDGPRTEKIQIFLMVVDP